MTWIDQFLPKKMPEGMPEPLVSQASLDRLAQRVRKPNAFASMTSEAETPTQPKERQP
jgi:hypothetical protein